MKPPYAWQELTMLVAAAVGRPVKYDGLKYRDARGTVFDPVRDNADAAELAVRQSLTVRAAPGMTIASYWYDDAEMMVAEYDRFNDGDPMKSFRLAICRAILERSRHA